MLSNLHLKLCARRIAISWCVLSRQSTEVAQLYCSWHGAESRQNILIRGARSIHGRHSCPSASQTQVLGVHTEHCMAACWKTNAISLWCALRRLARVCHSRAPEGARTTFHRCNFSDVTPALQVDLLDSPAAPINTIKGRARKRFVSKFSLHDPPSDMNITRCPDPRSLPRTRLRPSKARPDISGVRMQGEPNGVRLGTDRGFGRYGLPADSRCTGTTTAFARSAMAQRFKCYCEPS